MRPLLLAAALLLALPSAQAAAQGTQRFFDAQGRLVGTARAERGTTRYFDAQGRLVGTARGTPRPDAARPGPARPPQR